MYGTFNLTNLFQENFVLLGSLGLFRGKEKKSQMLGEASYATPTQTRSPSGLPAAEALSLGG